MRSARVYLLVFVGLVLPVSGGIAYWGRQSNPENMLYSGLFQLDQGLTEEAVSIAQSLDERGYVDHASLLRGEVWRRKGLALASSTTAESASDTSRASRARQAFQQALAEFCRVRANDPLALDSQVAGGECLVRLGERKLAEETFAAVVKRKADHKEAHRWLAAIYIDLNSGQKAIEHLRAWGELEPSNGRPYRWIGLFCKDAKRADEAIEAYQEALRRDLEPALRTAVVEECAQALMELRGDYQGSLRLLTELPEGQRQQPNLLMIEAQCLLGQGQSARAGQVVDKVLGMAPESVPALRLRAKIHLAENPPRQALSLLEKAVKADPYDIESLQALMLTYRRLGDNAAADRELRRLGETKSLWDELTKLQQQAWRAPWDDQIRCRIGELCQRIHRPAEARMWLTAALDCNPDNQRAKQLLKAAAP
ncbi:MAG TPA: tetratricopeptide repeat protein [Gemmataceae bacterium]|nr:tetratricopeptide repeat protein [Gemmataceae bacterium]